MRWWSFKPMRWWLFKPMRWWSGGKGKNLFCPSKSRESPAFTPTFQRHFPEMTKSIRHSITRCFAVWQKHIRWILSLTRQYIYSDWKVFFFSPISPSSAPPSDLVAHKDSFLRATWTNLVEMLLVTMMWRHATFLSCYGPVWKIKWQQTQAVKIIDTSPNIEPTTISTISYHMDYG